MFIRFLILSLFLHVNLSAQVFTVKTEIITISLEKTDNSYFYASANEVFPLPLGSDGLGDPFPYVGPQKFIVHKTIEGFIPPNDGEKPIPPVGVITLPNGSKRVLLICYPQADKTIRFIAYDISKSSMKEGDYRIFNFSSSDLAIILGTKKTLILSKQDSILSDAQWGQEILDLQCQIGVRQADGNSINPSYSGVWGHRPVRRNMLFLFDGGRGKDSIEIRRFYDIILVPDPNLSPDPEQTFAGAL